ncbi:phosphoenolpyruvate carboxykinase (ATP) [Solidesulfovibrio sp.]|uniref:phosphoenolpyruvate carboxykinase (ATP) n=1 Tax=Solidesulfovibrio sp. TaxID=2910990 RepID=UPI002B20B629|nr:phosphoenolpyruvate carboxykinase (ATP) [Solidesulfovibrio sp.]MEA4854857.1 phosphoenolpyruvate carboxykinase (ATP) [Solidesulfovibrio sp.]
MASLASHEYYRDDMTRMPALRSIAQTLCLDGRVRKVTAAEAYALAKAQHDVMVTDLPIYPPAAARLGLPEGATVLNNCHGRIVGRTAKARRFYTRMEPVERRKVEADLREAVYEMRRHPLIKAEAVLGLDPDLMIKATIVATEDDAVNVFNWLANFTPYEELAEVYAKSPRLPSPDILVVGFNHWKTTDPYYHTEGGSQLALVDEDANVIFNLGMRYFGERKKGTLTLAWTSGMRLRMAACHGGIKEIDFSGCAAPEARRLGKRSIAFFGLSGTGKSSHTNSHDNGGTLPEGFSKVVLHDDAFQIDCQAKVCRVWEPTLFDKTDSRPLGHPDWRYMISTMNLGLTEHEGKVLPLGQDVRNPNGRALIDRDLLGSSVNRCAFPDVMVWLMKDTCLPPVVRFADKGLAVAMGASLMTRRNLAENVSEEELKKLVFEPFANPFRVYELWKDVEAFLQVFAAGAVGYAFTSGGFWKTSDRDLRKIPLATSLTLQTALLLEQLTWRDWDRLPGAQLPTRESVDALIPGYTDAYDPAGVENRDRYAETLKDRFHQRRVFLQNSDLHNRPELLMTLVNALMARA